MNSAHFWVHVSNNADFCDEFCLLSGRAEGKHISFSKSHHFYSELCTLCQKHKFLRWKTKTPSPNLLAGGCWPGLCRSYPLHCLSMVPERLRMNAPLILIDSRSQGPVTANIDGKNGAASNTQVFTMNMASFYSKADPKHILLQNYQFLPSIMCHFSKT